jgi:hypothetical protein
MIVWTQQSRYDMRPGEFMRQLEALEREAEPFATVSGISSPSRSGPLSAAFGAGILLSIPA